MKTVKHFLTVVLICLLAFTSIGATIQWYSQQPVTTTPRDGDIMVLETTGPQGYKSFTLLTLKNWIGTNGPSTFYITNLVVNNVYGSNAYFTNLTVLNEFHGKTTISTNLYVSNAFITNLYVTNAYITNLSVQFITNNTAFITNLNVNNEYVTNLFISQNTTNFFLFSTNIYNSDVTVSNYFVTNVFQNTFMSNFFVTNQVFYETNLFVTYLTTTNFLTYISNSFVSNFFNTNIFVNNSYVSNFYTTNLFNTIEITSNYTFNVAWPLTNATLYGVTTFSPITGTSSGKISLLSTNTETISLSASNASIAAGVFWFKTNLWSGPTNNLPMNVEDQYYTTATDINVTNLNNLPTAGYSAGVTLSLTNSSAANIVFRFPSSIIIPERTNAVVLSNASGGIFSLKYSPVRGTNAVWRQF